MHRIFEGFRKCRKKNSRCLTAVLLLGQIRYCFRLVTDFLVILIDSNNDRWLICTLCAFGFGLICVGDDLIDLNTDTVSVKPLRQSVLL